MRFKETNIRTGEYHFYDSDDRKKEIELNIRNHMLGWQNKFEDMENGDVIIVSPIEE